LFYYIGKASFIYFEGFFAMRANNFVHDMLF
jgi:hypothetical protein